MIVYPVIFGFISQGPVNFKFGVLYAKDGQLTDEEVFGDGELFTFFLAEGCIKYWASLWVQTFTVMTLLEFILGALKICI